MAESLVEILDPDVEIDETAGLQKDDVDLGVTPLPADFAARLSTLGAPASPDEAAVSSGSAVRYSPAGVLGNVALTDSNGDPLAGVDSGFDRTSTGNDILLYTDDGNDNIVLGRDAVTDEIVFAIYLTEPAGDPLESSIWVVEYDAIEHDGADTLNDGDGNDHDASYDLANLVYVTAFEEQTFSFANAPAGNNLHMGFGTASQALVITGEAPANESEGENVSSGDTVNSSGATDTTLGTNGQQIKAQDAIVVTFVTGANPDYLAGPGAGNNPGQPLSPTEANEEDKIEFSGYVLANSAEFTISQMTPGNTNTTTSLEIHAYLTADSSGDAYIDDNPLVDGDTAINITTDSVEVLRGGVNVVGTLGVSVDYTGDGVVVTGVKDDDVVRYATDSDHNRVLIRNDQPEKGSGSNVAFDLGGFTLTEVAGDTDEVGSKIFFYDDGPFASANATVLLDDDALAGGNPGGVGDDVDAANTFGTLGHSFGADGAGSIAWLTSGAPAGFSYALNGTDLEISQNGEVKLTLTVNATTGAYTVTQNNPIDHVAGNDENNQTFTVNYRVTDADGDFTDSGNELVPPDGSIDINVDDDTPTVAANATVLLDDDALAGGNPGGVGDDADAANTSGTLGHSFGADGAGSIAWLTTGAPTGFSYAPDGDNLLIKQGTTTVITLTLIPTTGAYTVTQNNPIAHAAGNDENNQLFTVAYRVTDSDDDTAEGSIDINVDDDTPTVAANATVAFDDDALSGGNPGGTGDDTPDTANTSGTLGHSFGADGAGSIAWLTTGAPAGFAYVPSGDDLLIQQDGTTVITLTLNTATGAYTATQNAPIAHAAGNDENNQLFTVAYRVTDGDSDFVDGSIGINVDDDTPTVAANATVLLDDDALAGGNPGGVGDDVDAANTSGTLGHSFGADGAGSIEWLESGAPAGFTYELSGGDLLVKQGSTTVLTLTVNATTGAYTVTQNNPIAHAAGNDENNQLFSVAYRVTDSDDDTAEGSIGINVDDDTPTVAANATVLLDDDALAGGNPGGVGDDADAANTSGTLGHSFGADGAGSIAWLTSGAPSGFSYVPDGDNLLIKQGTTTVITLTLIPTTGAYTATQNNPIDHVAGNEENNQLFSVAYRVTDGDDDTADGSIDINVDDDTPTIAVGDASGTYADPAEATGTFLDGPGADGFGDLSITFDSYEIDDLGVSSTSGDADITFTETVTDTTWTGSIDKDFNGDGEPDLVEFTLDVDRDSDSYTVTVDTPPGQVVVLSTEEGSLDAGGPDPVRTLTLTNASQVVFSAVVPTTEPGDISDFLNESEAFIEDNADHLSDDEMNVSTAGIGNDNNNFDGNANSGIDGDTTRGGKVDESFVVDPTDFDVSSVKVYIDNSVGGYDNPPEELYYLVYDADGNTEGDPILVTDTDLSPEAGGQVSFVIGDPEGENNIDAVQLFMGSGTIKIPVIEFTTSESFDPEDLAMNFTATLEDGDQDTATDTFSVFFDNPIA
ncbi:beta strand repeat-containing protein [Halomonas maura]|uniref:beta strand repeat-containing protein n=1 Tax=Halomonas maura TaxID=117606 RepID=UPI0025B3455B|nr:DUF5801 repeats-in-toxin domain-containing protein [Halomonas maura]MDN3557047.1 DUF5801 repeats-in-toxin domain-containing protein [Halomonas maura]